MSGDPQELRRRYGPKESKVLKADRQMCTVRFSPCGRFLAAGGSDGTVRRWDLTAAEMPEVPPLTGHHGWVQALAFHPDARRLFTADSWGQVRCWPYAEPGGGPLWTIEEAHDGWIRQVALSPDGTLLATCGSDRTVRIWSADDGRRRRELAAAEDLFSVAFHPGGRALVAGDLKGVLTHWDLETGRGVREIDARLLYLYDRIQDVGGVRCLAFDPPGAVLVCAGSQPKSGGFVQGTPLVLLFDWATGRLRHSRTIGKESDGFVHDVALHPDGFVMGVTSGQPGSGQLFFQGHEDVAPFFLATHMANCHSLSMHPDGGRLVVAATNAGSNGNGRQLKDNEYQGNWSPLHILDLPRPAG